MLESELGTNTSKDLGRLLTDFSAVFSFFVIIITVNLYSVFFCKRTPNTLIRQVSFFDKLIRFAVMLDFVKLVPKQKWPFKFPSHPQKSLETKSWTFLLQPMCYVPGRFDEDRLGGLRNIASNFFFNKKTSRVLVATLEGAQLIIVNIWQNTHSHSCRWSDMMT